jgi:phosphoglucosamine mutase
LTERRIFGTDGVRGVAGEFLTADLALRLGRAAALEAEAERPQVLIIRDTRESGPMLEDALAAGVASAGGDAILGGVLPSPAASVLARRYSFDLAAVVSASHNPFSDNGVKFMSGAGTKLSDEEEAGIEARVDAEGSAAIGRVRKLEGALDDYLRELRTTFPLDLSGLHVALDCANGAAYRAAPAIFERLGAEVTELATEPDGRNINLDCGSTAPGALAELVGSGGADVGFAFDGDADRLVAVDGRGRIRDGDDLLALAARHLSAAGELGGGVAVTVMTNYGFHQALEADGIPVVETDVGDRYVLEELLRRDWMLGGEQSGHIIWRQHTPSGDGIAAALLTLRALGGDRLEEVEPFERLPQRLENVEVADLAEIAGAEGLWTAVGRENSALEGRGRVLVRASGTEPLLRIMVEAPEDDECERVLSRLLTLARSELG